jgi:hypothetical protein
MSYGIGCHYLAHKIIYAVRSAYVCACARAHAEDNLTMCLVVYLLGVGLYALSPCAYQISSNEVVKIFQNNLFTA